MQCPAWPFYDYTSKSPTAAKIRTSHDVKQIVIVQSFKSLKFVSFFFYIVYNLLYVIIDRDKIFAQKKNNEILLYVNSLMDTFKRYKNIKCINITSEIPFSYLRDKLISKESDFDKFASIS